MLRAMVSTVAIGLVIALSCQSCAAQAPVGQTLNPRPGSVGTAQGVPATQPAGANGLQRREFTATVAGGSSGIVAGPGGVTITLGEQGDGAPGAAQPIIPPPPGQVRHAWRELGGRDEAREGREEGEGIFVNGRRIDGLPSGGWAGVRPPMMLREASVKLEKAAYLGLFTSPVSEELASQLGLAKGVGLVVDVIDEDGPAKKAGLEKFDVLTKLDDQLVINPPQLQVLVRMHKAGDDVKLTVFRKAKETVLSVKLVEKEVPPLQPFWGMMPGMRPDREEAEEAREHRGQGPMLFRLREPGPREGSLQTTVSVADKEHVITSATDPVTGKTILTATDAKTGKVIFKGPIDTLAERKAAPPEILKKWDAMRIEIRPGTPAGPGAAPASPWVSTQPGAGKEPPNPAPAKRNPMPPPPPPG